MNPMEELPTFLSPEQRRAFWAEVVRGNRDAFLARHVPPLMAEVEALTARLPWPMRLYVRLYVLVKGRGA